MPMSNEFEQRLYPLLPDIAQYFGTPFHIYDEKGIRQTGEALKGAFAAVQSFQEFFAVKALPNPAILDIMHQLGFGFDCSSIPELTLARQAGAQQQDIMFSSNNTSEEEFVEAVRHGGCILNFDDITFVEKVPDFPELISFRYNPGDRRTGSSFIGKPTEAKYGLRHDQLIEAYRQAMERGAKRFGLHAMIISNELHHDYMEETIKMLLETVEIISGGLGVAFEFINIGGGIGIPYKPEEKPFNITALAQEAHRQLEHFKDRHGYVPRLFMESGRYMTGPHGVLVTSVINRMSKHREFLGVDASMASLMRPGMYGAYHHITVSDPKGRPKQGAGTAVDVVGSLCENNDKFAAQRTLPDVNEGDLLLIHDTGAHGHSMGFTYNGRLRPKELLLRGDRTVELIRREETTRDYFGTLEFKTDILAPRKMEQ